MVVSPGQWMAILHLGTRRLGMISGVGTFGQAGAYRPVPSSWSLRSHDSDRVGRVVYSPTHESGLAVPLKPRVEFSRTELFGGRHYRFGSGRQWGTVESNLLEGEPFVSSTHSHCDRGGQYGGPGGRT